MRHLIAGLAFLALVAVMPCLAQADDEAIAKEIVSKLRQAQDSGAIKGFSVDLEVDEGAVWMKGHFSSAEHKAHALGIAQRVKGVTQVVDDLELKQANTARKPVFPNVMNEAAKNVFKQASSRLKPVKPTAKPEPKAAAPAKKQAPAAPAAIQPLTDQELAQRVIGGLRQLKDSGQLKGFHIDVDVNDASVWIRGDVASASQRSLILESARRVAGVKQVVNDIAVRPATRRVETTPLVAKRQQPPVGTAVAAQPKPAASKPIVQQPIVHPVVQEPVAIEPIAQQPAVAAPATPAPAPATIAPAPEKIAPAPEKIVETPAPAKTAELPATVARPITPEPAATARTEKLITREEAAAIARQEAKEIARLVAQEIARPKAEAKIAKTTAVEAKPEKTQVPAGYMLVPVAPSYPLGYQPRQQLPQVPLAVGTARTVSPTAAYTPVGGAMAGGPVPMHRGGGANVHPAQYEHPQLPGYAWPSYAAYPNYGAVSYPKQHSAGAWPYIGPFYPYPQVPLGWRKVQLQWDDGWWFLDFTDR